MEHIIGVIEGVSSVDDCDIVSTKKTCLFTIEKYLYQYEDGILYDKTKIEDIKSIIVNENNDHRNVDIELVGCKWEGDKLWSYWVLSDDNHILYKVDLENEHKAENVFSWTGESVHYTNNNKIIIYTDYNDIYFYDMENDKKISIENKYSVGSHIDCISYHNDRIYVTFFDWNKGIHRDEDIDSNIINHRLECLDLEGNVLDSIRIDLDVTLIEGDIHLENIEGKDYIAYYQLIRDDNKFRIRLKYLFEMKDDTFHIICGENKKSIRDKMLSNIKNMFIRKKNMRYWECDHKKYLIHNIDDTYVLVYTSDPMIQDNDTSTIIQTDNFHQLMKKERDTVVLAYWCLSNVCIYLPRELKFMIIHRVLE